MFRIIVDLYSLQVKYKVTSATDNNQNIPFFLLMSTSPALN